MGRGTSGATVAPEIDGAGIPADSDQKLVARVRRGDDRAFEVLYQRYHRRIHAYVLGMVKDHGRAEDVTQEVFLSALRRMRETEQPLAFKAWLYQIAKNSCIDAFRRSRRAEEVSYDAEEGLAPADHSKLIASGASPDAALAAKQDLDSLCGAFGGLSETHHEILVLRELEGLSYQEIGRRMGMSRPAVESTLFRARRRLTEEYDDIVSGARCQRIQDIIVAAAQTRLGARDTRRLARHLSHCQLCRREALAAGLDRSLFTRPTVRERAAAKVAGILPFPIFAKFRKPGQADAAAAAPSGRSASLMQHVPMFSEHLQSGWGKAATGAAVIVAGVGAGIGVKEATTSAPAPPAVIQPAASGPGAAPARKTSRAGAPIVAPERAAIATATAAATRSPERRAAKQSAPKRSGAAGAAPAGTPQAAEQPRPDPVVAAERDDTGSTAPRRRPTKPAAVTKPTPDAPRQSKPAADPVKPVTDTAGAVVDKTADQVQKTTGAVAEGVDEVTQKVDDVVEGVTGSAPVPKTVEQIPQKAGEVVDGAGKTAGQAVGAAGKTVEGLTGGANPGLGG